jgi:hypothetical protein
MSPPNLLIKALILISLVVFICGGPTEGDGNDLHQEKSPNTDDAWNGASIQKRLFAYPYIPSNAGSFLLRKPCPFRPQKSTTQLPILNSMSEENYVTTTDASTAEVTADPVLSSKSKKYNLICVFF